MVYGISNEFMRTILKADAESIDEALLQYNQNLLDFVKASVEPLMIINQEINPLLLIASKELEDKLIQLKYLIVDFNNEMQNCLSKINVTDSNSFKVLETVTHDERWKEFQALNDEILTLMREEINVK